MRILIVTDSLGMPRNDMPIDDIWVNKTLEKHKQEYDMYTFLIHSLSTKHICETELEADLFNLFKPSIIIFQVGINDCVRHAIPRRMLALVKLLRLRRFIAKHHYRFTAIFKFKEVSENDFRENLQRILYLCEEKSIKVAFIRIADAGESLVKRIANSQNDIEQYNRILEETIKEWHNATYLNPYAHLSPGSYNLEDGVHLIKEGHEHVFKSVSSWLLSLQQEG